MLLARPLRPQHVVEEQVGGVRRGQPAQLEARPVDDDLPQAADLGVDVQGHGCLQRGHGEPVIRNAPEPAIPERLRGARPLSTSETGSVCGPRGRMTWSRSSSAWRLPRRPPGGRPSGELIIAGCFVCFARDRLGPGAAGEPAWAAAVALRGHRHWLERSVRVRRAAVMNQACWRSARAHCSRLPSVTCPPNPPCCSSTRPGAITHGARAWRLHLGAVLGLPTVGVTHRGLLAAHVRNSVAHPDWPA